MSATLEQYFDQLLQKDLSPRNLPPKAKLSLFYREHKELIEHLASGIKTRVEVTEFPDKGSPCVFGVSYTLVP